MPYAVRIAGAYAALALLLAGAWVYHYAHTPRPLPDSGVIVQVPRGLSAGEVAHLLSQQGVIDRPGVFELLVRLSRSAQSLKWGEYYFESPCPPVAVLEKLRRGAVVTYPVTVPEGSTLADVLRILEGAGFGPAEVLQDAAADPDWLDWPGLSETGLEGVLFPDTYRFSRDEAPETILQEMTDRFSAVFAEEARATAGQTGLTERETLILASLVEKETALPRERPVVAAVYLNRLQRNMRLECDPTVIYAVTRNSPSFSGRLRRRHLRDPSPYNTYRHRGLPPGPICNPGRAALRAALAPAAVDYLYFVSRNDGSHVFSRTYAEHAQAVRRYQSGRGRRNR